MPDKEKDTAMKGYIIKIFGIVQGVGFRPYVYNLAHKYDIRGFVNNSGASLVIDAEGNKEHIREFILHLIHDPPQLARIESIEIICRNVAGYKGFAIQKSDGKEENFRFISTDVGVCPECMEEVSDMNSRWYQYPFTNCTKCGPRYSIIEDFPYDRKDTTMKLFDMCPSCREDYENPLNRRFHAQPTCCPACGPTLSLLDRQGERIQCDDVIGTMVELIKRGKIIAMKGLGGFHLVCNAEDQEAILLLRQRKHRPHKPLAIMAKDMEYIKNLCYVNEMEEGILQSNRKPIVLLNRRKPFVLPEIIAPDTQKLGMMLPYTPLHYMLFQKDIHFLVMTSGNTSNAPIQYQDEEALNTLNTIADYFLMHNRHIHTPVDDSVVRVFQKREMTTRIGRGYAPFIVKTGVKNEILALGAEQKSTFCLSKNGYGYISQYLGDIKDFDAYKLYQNTIEHLIKLTNINPEIIAYDMHPGFVSRNNLDKYKGKKVSVQHHHAHMVSCMVEHRVNGPVIGVVYDGTGYGSDGNVWGGEFFIGTIKEFERVGHFKYVSLQGGDQSVKEPWRIALCYLDALGYDPRHYLDEIRSEKIDVIQQALKANMNCYQSSSVGRLFDCISAILGLCHEISYDAQAAIILENVVDPTIHDFYRMEVSAEGKVLQIDYKSMIEGVLLDLDYGVPLSIISSKFHNALCNTTVQVVQMLSEQYGLSEVALSGGCFENQYLLSKTVDKLRHIGMKVFYNQKIPINDSGVSIGQLVIADQTV
ncbi:hydrogenase maturation protein HypF [Anaerosolibacter carboniphilus]|uniref:Carbamoyltransferase n=1 Tax=Anaerosolibacter carboniphilus TaxID=1417629 RepID=A0A841L368_9FIRM|nr:carbamoyltransferase HypF [Anaerosolibacter carboniphilus]MBB6218610.1 hydrogenase maturation protein HypF [Anaerosolibacter carboniphilus]